MKNIREWFPSGRVTDHPNPPVGYVAHSPAGPTAMVATEEEELESQAGK